ncbi:unnamed protein product [Hymenolepis diminuta]|uniref:SID1 transmembrane family member 1 n=1 Tax=Hymenolepis diminuta TaxID=6216 RepID=A0A564ZF36_HYMDI|nr:unnamed protein product [Hymenolepis diminuta]
MCRSHLACVNALFYIYLCLVSIDGADFSVDYNGTVSLKSPKNYTYSLAASNFSAAVRVDISATNVNKAYPLIAVFKQQANVLSFPLPLVINDGFMYNSVSRTLCPSFIALDNKGNNSEQIFVELSSSVSDESRAPSYHLRLDVLHNFELALYQKVELSITPSEPQYYLFNFPEDVDSVMVRVHSRDKLCMTVSVQAARCPVADILDTVKYSGVYQTVTTLGAMTVNKLDQNITKFLVVLVLKPEDYDCGGPVTIIKPGNATTPRIKNISLTVTPSLAGYHYYLPIYGAIGIYVMFYIAATVIILVYRSYDRYVRYHLKFSIIPQDTFSVLDHRNPINMSPPPVTYDGQLLPTSTAAYTHLPTSVEDGPITRDRRAFAPNNGSSSTLTSTNVSTSYQRIPPPPLSHSLFSSSSSSDVEARSDSIQLQEAPTSSSSAAAKRKPKKLRRLPLLTLTSQLQGGIRAKQSHRRSMSYGSTREMGLRAALLPSTSGEVEQNCSACSKVSLGGAATAAAAEGGAGDVTRGPISSIRPPPMVRHVEEGLEVSEDLHMDEEGNHEEETRKNRHLYLQNRILFVSDLSRKRYSTLDRKYLLYFWYLIIISIFYGLPVAQLVMTYQRALHDTGNEDICYYNFECAHPLGVFTAFNNIISNIGYVMLGLLFLGLTARRDFMHRRTKKFGAYYSQLFCRWLCSRIKHRRNARVRRNSDNELESPTTSNSAATNVTSNWANGLAAGRSNESGQQPPASPDLSVVSSTAPMITITRYHRRLDLLNCLCSTSAACCTCCCCCQTNDQLDRHSSAGQINDGPMLGVYHKDHQSNDESDEDYLRNRAFGIPQHYGLFYAMGLALTMEGLLSACYHICPSFSNFQFDTAYMYILALILMLKIYQTRHPDINASAHSAYMVMAVVILAGVTGVLYGGETFWVVFTIVFLTMSIWLTAEIYYMGQWNFDICLPRRLYHLMRSDGIHCLTPMYMERMLLLLVANCVNIGIAAFGLFTRPRDFASFLLSIFMINLLMYYCFYVIMKCRYRERFHCIPLLYIFLACITWGFAIYFFIQHSTTWEVTPAQSRALNQPCIFLGFYDVHDVWHFLSSTSMFFSFMSIMTLDDDLINTPRNKIPVF